MSLLQELLRTIEAKDKMVTELQVSMTRDDMMKTKEIASIRKTQPDLAEALSLQWGHEEFYKFIEKVLKGEQIGPHKFLNLTPIVLQQLGGLVTLHSNAFSNGVPAEKKVDTNNISPEYEFNFVKGARQK